MSIEAMLWAFKQSLDRSAEKLVLLELSNHAGTDNTAWPSLVRLCEKTNLNRKTVISALDGLEGKQLISDTGERKGISSQIKVYRLNLSQSSLNGTVPETEPYQKTVPYLPETVPFFPVDSTENGTRNLLLNHKESINTKGTRLPKDWKLPIEYEEAAKEIRPMGFHEIHNIADEFRDYWISVPGSKGVKLDWLATWRNWVRRSKPSTPSRNDEWVTK
jgi:hypothetical protein